MALGQRGPVAPFDPLRTARTLALATLASCVEPRPRGERADVARADAPADRGAEALTDAPAVADAVAAMDRPDEGAIEDADSPTDDGLCGCPGAALEDRAPARPTWCPATGGADAATEASADAVADAPGDASPAPDVCPDAQPVACAGRCVDLATDPRHCGMCGRACGPRETCADGACACREPFVECAGECLDPRADLRHCGDCDTPCVPNAACVDGRCSCPAPLTSCEPTAGLPGACVDLQTDALHCGACRRACRVDERCVSGSCMVGRRPVELALGADHACALMDDGGLVCWGDDSLGQLGGAGSVRGAPERTMAGRADFTRVFAGGNATCGLRCDGSATCWGALDGRSDLADRSALDRGVVEVATGAAVQCIRKEDGSVWCRGSNRFGALGDGSPCEDGGACGHTDFRRVDGLADVVQVAIGDAFACARLRGGTLRCWGANDHGQLGTGASGGERCGDTCGDPPVPCCRHPVAVPGVEGAVELAVGGAHVCVRFVGGGVGCWGDGSQGALDRPLLDAGTLSDRDHFSGLVQGIGGACQVVAGRGFSCALIGAAMSCWGALLRSEGGVTRMAAGDRRVCATVCEGACAIRCWEDSEAPPSCTLPRR